MNSVILFNCLVCVFRILSLGFAEKVQKNARILHGRIVDIKDHPYQVALVARGSRIICGGVIIKPRVVFTAAHCTHTINLTPRKNLEVLVGANHVNDDEGRLHKIKKVIRHPDFSYSGLDNDISVLLLEDPIEFSDKAQSIELETEDPPGGVKATVSGWGRTETGQPSHDLRAVNLVLEHRNKCQTYFPGVFHPTITDGMVCVKPHHKSTYYGDSGGPLTVNGKLVGLVSFGRTIKPSKKTTVFTRVGKHVDFVDDALPEEYKKDE